MFNFSFFNKTNIDLKSEVSNENNNIDTESIEILYSYIENRSGIALQKSKVLVKNKIISFCKKKSIKSFEILLNLLNTNETIWKEFINIITINETYFFREKSQIEESLQQYISTNKTLNILCAPSSTGEEVYSVMILALEMKIKNFKITGIDISSDAIFKAKKGIYNERSVHKVPKNILDKYFDILDSKYQIKNRFIQYIQFIECNLFESEISMLGRYDIIFSRNMFIYFKDSTKIEAYKKLESLKKHTNSNIYLGHADISSQLENYIRK